MLRFENLKFKNQRTDYRYFGCLECCYTLGTFQESKRTKGPSFDNILRKDEYEDNKKYCNTCSFSENCERKNDIFNDSLDCEMGDFFVENEVTQQVIFYNEKLNSAVVFSVDSDSIANDWGFDSIEDLLWDIYNGVNSPYSEGYLEDITDIEEALNKKDNLMFIRYINSIEVDFNICPSYRSLKDRKIYTLYDIISILNEGEEV